MTDLYRVQTTGDEPETVDVKAVGSFGYVDQHSNRRWGIGGSLLGITGIIPQGPHLNLRTLTRLHLLTDKELQARDAELLERALKAIADLPTPDTEAQLRGREDAYRAVEAMKGQTHER
jgi:hypothetical protein